MTRRRAAFTLVELLVALAIVGIISALALAGFGIASASADRSKAMGNMRAIGSAIPAYAADHNGSLPGPLWPGQLPELDPARSGRMVRELAPYLGIETPSQPETIGLFVPPAYRKAMGAAALATSRTFVMNMAVVDGAATLNPWGSLAGAAASSPLRLAMVPPSAWAFSDADRLHPRVSGAPWSANTPAEPVHGKRMAWFFNGSVVQVDTAELD